MARTRIPFLPLFLILLTAGFVVAVTIRARSYARMEQAVAVAPAATSTSVANDPLPPGYYRDATGALVPLPGTDTVSMPLAGNVTTVSSRAQRMRELLSEPLSATPARTTPPPKAPATTTITPTTQIKPPVVPPVRTPPAQPRPQPPTQPANNPNSGDKGGRGGDDKHDPNKDDPNSDVTPPRLLGAEFNPTQVHDGEEALLYLTATDDNTGIRGISGTVTSPSGKALQGFSAQKDEVPNRFVARVGIPKDAEEGMWRVNFISLSDNASNTANLHYSTGGIPPTAVVKVISSRSDSVGPTLRAVSLERGVMKGGERLQIFVEADDDKSGVKFVSGVFQSPAKFARISFGCQVGSPETMWTCTMNTPAILDCGAWQLEQIQLQDAASNMTTVRGDNPLVGGVRLNISADQCDSTPPVLQTALVDPRVVTNQQGSNVILTVNATDDIAGVYGVMAQAVGPGQGSGKWFPLNSTGEGTTWSGKVDIPHNAGKGKWKIAFIQVIDKGNNLRLYTSNDPQLANTTFEVR